MECPQILKTLNDFPLGGHTTKIKIVSKQEEGKDRLYLQGSVDGQNLWSVNTEIETIEVENYDGNDVIGEMIEIFLDEFSEYLASRFNQHFSLSQIIDTNELVNKINQYIGSRF